MKQAPGVPEHEEDAALANLLDEKDEKLKLKDKTLRNLKGVLLALVIVWLASALVLYPGTDNDGPCTFSFRVRGPGLQSTANYSSHVTLQFNTSGSSQCFSLQQALTVELLSVHTASVVPTAVLVNTLSEYTISFTPVARGTHKLHIKLDGIEIRDSPFHVTVYPDPTQLRTPLKVINVKYPWGIAINSLGEIIVSEWFSHRVSALDGEGHGSRMLGVGSNGNSGRIKNPRGIAVDDEDNVYVASYDKLKKISRDGKILKYAGPQGLEEEEFEMHGLGIHEDHIYVCEGFNHRIHVFDLNLNFIRAIGSHGSGREQFDMPSDVNFDNAGNLYVADFNNHRIQVLDIHGQFIRQFGHKEGEERVEKPTAVTVIGQFVYVSDNKRHRIAVYKTSGKFITSFGRHGEEVGQFRNPHAITSDHNGSIYACDYFNNRILVY